MRKILISVVFILLIFILSASSLANDKNMGETVYKKNCAGCHGKTGAGDGPAAVTIKPRPANFLVSSYKDSVGKSMQDYTESDLLEIIEYGRKGTAMPKWRKILTNEEIAEVLVYIRSLKNE